MRDTLLVVFLRDRIYPNRLVARLDRNSRQKEKDEWSRNFDGGELPGGALTRAGSPPLLP